MDTGEILNMKYNELQKLAKQRGIKANMKLDKLRKAVINHYKNTEVTVEKQVPMKTNEEKRDTPEVKKTRRSTFETVPTPELHTKKLPVLENSRRSTFVVKTPKSDIKKVADEIKKDTQKSDVKKVPNEINKDTPKSNVKKDPDDVNKDTSSKPDSKTPKTQIPRFAAFLAKKKQEEGRITPGKMKNWTKIHERNFEKMDSIDVYLEKKRKRNEDYADSVKKTKKILQDTMAMVDKLKNYKTPNTGENNKDKKTFITKTPSESGPVPFKPSVLSTKEMNLNFTSNRKSPRTSASKPFKPTVFSTKNMNLNFNGSPKAQKDKSLSARRSSSNKSFTTPFKFNASLNNTLNGSMSAKKTFDLKASLARPITWKAHKGKLKPLSNQTSGPNYLNTSLFTPTTQNRNDRRKEMTAKRSSMKFDSVMSRRGIQS